MDTIFVKLVWSRAPPSRSQVLLTEGIVYVCEMRDVFTGKTEPRLNCVWTATVCIQCIDEKKKERKKERERITQQSRSVREHNNEAVCVYVEENLPSVSEKHTGKLVCVYVYL